MGKIAGRIVTHTEEFKGTVVFDEATGLIKEVKRSVDSDARLFGDESIIFPGFGDIHIHAREDVSGKHCYKEDFVSAGNAGIGGAVLHVADMPNNPVPPVDDKSYEDKLALTKKSPIHITLYAGIGPATKPLLKKVPYKVFMGPSIGELFFEDNVSLENTIRHYQGQDVSFHCEDPEILTENKNKPTHEERRPKEAETLATEFALSLIEKYNLKGKLCHYSTKDGLNKIIEAKKRGVNVTCEVTPTHLMFDTSMLTDDNRIWFQMNPPLRGKEDREAMVKGILDGHIDFLATDHAPHSIEEKKKGTSGISQLDTYGLFVTYMINILNIPLQTIARICAKNPGDFVKQYLPEKFGSGFGEIKEGYAANFSVLNLKKPFVFEKSMIKSKSGWSPFEGFEFPGSIEAVYFLGKDLHAK
ncbi:amidohydrolase family protein [Leptospira ilyithenensis]|uniref:Amidohydrolase n=1 Tax=Leptospira ilyithenensis TaxID=2484901 RepID=A0A4R9LMV2_9LEPT|nr:amidohydrolase family protein [Leptospira ilyithenensis]TGN06551.1 amidohydrolase [Leptospira ilyithenensis]